MKLPNKKYNIIYADPPWRYYNYKDDTASRWVGNQYPLMAVEDICNLPVAEIADDNCILFLWTTAPTFPDAFKVIKAWGFQYKTKAFCWVKQNKKTPSLFWGMGYWTRSNTEDVLLAVKGKNKRINAGIHQVIISPVSNHSQKPAIVRNRIVQLCGNLPRIELFARQTVEGWDAWGKDAPKKSLKKDNFRCPHFKLFEKE